MTITYSKKVASVTTFGVFVKLLFRWKGSVYKMIWPELIVYCICYIICSIIYIHILSEDGKRSFRNLSSYFGSYVDSIPMTFVLGFYVSMVVSRWWGQYKTIPWPDNLAILVSNSIQGMDVKTRMMRRTMVRYINLSLVLTFRVISPGVNNRFKTFDNMVDEGLLLNKEKIILEDVDEQANGSIYWVPLVWAVSLLESAKRELYITNDLAVTVIVNEINNFRSNCGALLGYDKLNIPLAYTQVVTLAVYSYLMATLMARQFLKGAEWWSGSSILEMYVPIFTVLEFLIYLGWLKVAESLVNPFGNDDEDFDLDGLINRNLKISYLIADKMLDSHPEIQEDKHWGEVFHKQSLIPEKKLSTEPEKRHLLSVDNVEDWSSV